MLPFVGIKEKCHAPYREVLCDEEHCVTNQIKLFYAETNMALLMLESEEYSQQVVKHKNYHTVPENIHYHPQLLGGMPKTLNKCLKLLSGTSRWAEGEKMPSLGEVWIFSGTTYCNMVCCE